MSKELNEPQVVKILLDLFSKVTNSGLCLVD